MQVVTQFGFFRAKRMFQEPNCGRCQQFLRRVLLILCAGLLALMSGCAQQRGLQRIVEESQFHKALVRSSNFTHVVYMNQAFYAQSHSTVKRGKLYVFLEGDGLPWQTRTRISSNPESVYPLALDLMSLNQSPGLYLQRPCYGIKPHVCDNKWWTSHRYSATVVASMVQVLEGLSSAYGQIILVGYSGGGTLAVLIADQLNNVSTVITLAGNMDHTKWTEYHHYSDLQGSLNAIDYVLPAKIQQYHYAGENDENILPQWIKAYSHRQLNAQYLLIRNIDHSCCWLDIWPDIVKNINITATDKSQY